MGRSNPSGDLDQMSLVGRYRGRNHVCNISWLSVKGCGCGERGKFAFSHWLDASPLQHWSWPCDMSILYRYWVSVEYWRDLEMWVRVRSRSWKMAPHQMNVWSISASISVTSEYILTQFGTEHKCHTINMSEWPNFHNLKIQDVGGRHLEFRKNVNNSGLDKDICTKFYRKMHHGHAEMTTWPKVETGS